MANSFSRTTRSLSADGHTTTLIGLLVVIFLFAIWGAWFFAAGIPIRLSSEVAQITRSQRVTATFPTEDAGEIVRGQPAYFYPQGKTWAHNGPIPAIVSRVSEDPARDIQLVEIALRFEHHLPAPLKDGLKGRVDIELERVSPATMILRSAGMVNQNKGELAQ